MVGEEDAVGEGLTGGELVAQAANPARTKLEKKIRMVGLRRRSPSSEIMLYDLA